QTFNMLNNADLKFPNITDKDGNVTELTHGRYHSFMESTDRSVRKSAFEAMHNTYGKFENTFAATLSNEIKTNNVSAKIRKFESDELHMYDLYTPLVQDVDMKVTYEEAQEQVLESLKPLGTDYTEIIKEAFNNRWIDVLENVGKRSGAYSSGTYATNPYILMNWQDNVNNMFTLTHELGHSVHSYYTKNNQPYRYGNYSIFVAEVASTTNEALLSDYLLNNLTDEKERLYVLNYFLEGFRATVFRQT